jgi:hypothetical protein
MATPTFILPSAPTYTEGFVNGLNVYPNPTNFVANQVPFTRATTATRTNAAGLIELVPYNLLQYSEMFSQSIWTKLNGSTLTPNTILAPNGTLTADTFQASNLAFGGILRSSITANTGTTYTFSFYAKKNNYRYVGIRFNTSTNVQRFPNYDFDTDTLNKQGVTCDLSRELLPNGWVRLVLTFTATNTSGGCDIGITTANGDTSTALTGTEKVEVWGAQLVEGTDALPYQLTETRLNRPRVDFSLGGCPSLLLEPQRTNLFAFSEQFDNALWIKNAGTISTNSTTSPSGLTNAETFTGDGTSGQHQTYQGVVLTSGVVYTITTYVKKNTNNFLQIYGSGGPFGGANFWANFDLNNGVIGSVGTSSTASIQSVGNGWYRCTMTATAIATGSTNVILHLINSATSARGETNSLSTSVFLWGAQLEAGAYQTSYIPTSSASVTRNIDVAQLTGAQILIGQTEGTLYWEGTLTSGFDDIFYLNRSVTNSVFLYKNAINNIIFRIYYNNLFITITNATAYTGTVKIAASYKSGDSVLYINGVQVGTSSTAFAFTGDLADIVLNNTAYLFGNATKSVKSAAIYNTRLTNAELATLTTL